MSGDRPMVRSTLTMADLRYLITGDRNGALSEAHLDALFPGRRDAEAKRRRAEFRVIQGGKP